MKHLALLTSLVAVTSAQAALFWSPTLALFPLPGPLVLGPMVAPSLVSTVVDNVGNFTATLTTTVHSGGSNPLGGLTFVYTLQNTPNVATSPNDDLYAFSVRWDPSYSPPVIDVDTAAPGVTPFSFAYGVNGIAFSFNFVSLPEPLSSVGIAVGTAAPRWVLGQAGVIDGTTEDAQALVPVPEPRAWALVPAIGLAAFAIWRRMR